MFAYLWTFRAKDVTIRMLRNHRQYEQISQALQGGFLVDDSKPAFLKNLPNFLF